MPKPVPLSIQVEEPFVIGVMRRLHTMPGVVSMAIDFRDKPAAPPAPNGVNEAGPKRRCQRSDASQLPTAQVVANLVAAGKTTFVMNDVHEVYAKHGLTPTKHKASNFVHRVVRLRPPLIKSVGKGKYRFTPAAKTYLAELEKGE